MGPKEKLQGLNNKNCSRIRPNRGLGPVFFSDTLLYSPSMPEGQGERSGMKSLPEVGLELERESEFEVQLQLQHDNQPELDIDFHSD